MRVPAGVLMASGVAKRVTFFTGAPMSGKKWAEAPVSGIGSKGEAGAPREKLGAQPGSIALKAAKSGGG